ncbi:putative ATP-dependent RNA helicase TDRD12 [Condylostylus longicornis]|uniref:putative ATP-dependent RNA helicase TDRD12 n=1 Tax=Condylostylus longicornis TaxID=2530218 RepID=UPI00244DE7C5|nr:putative ATP-dependent RNA helicase TDRD12 [Condylostylus longicornis]
MNSNSEYNEKDYTIDDIIITHFINPSMFWYRISNEVSEELFNLDQELFKCFSSNRYKEYIPKQKEIVLLYVVSESRCCRAKVEEIFEYRATPKKYMLWAIDHGKVYSSNSKFIRELPKNLAEVQIENVFFGGLNNLVPAKQTFDYRRYDNIMQRCEKWSSETCRLFDEAVKDAYTLEFVIQRKIKDQYFGELRAAFHTNNRISINDMLIKSKGAMKEANNFVHILNELGLNQRAYVLTNENDISKYNQNTLNKNNYARPDKIDSGITIFHETDVKANQGEKNSETMKEEKDFEVNENLDEEIALNKKIKEWNLGNSKFSNTNIEKIRKFDSTINENDIRESVAEISLSENTPPQERELKSKNVEYREINDSEITSAQLKMQDVKEVGSILNINDKKLLAEDPFNIDNLPLKSNERSFENKSVSGRSNDSNESRKTAREKVLERVKNRKKSLAEIAAKPQLNIPAGYDMRNMQQNILKTIPVNDTGKVDSKIEPLREKEKGPENEISSFQFNTSDIDSKDSSVSMAESVKIFLGKHSITDSERSQKPLRAFEIQLHKSHNSNSSSTGEASPSQQKIEFIERENTNQTHYTTKSNSSHGRSNFLNKSPDFVKGEKKSYENKKPYIKRTHRDQTNNKQSVRKDGFEELDDICVPTSTIGKDSVLVHGVVPVPVNRLVETQFTHGVHNKMEMLGHREIYRVQQYCWPHLLRFNSLILVNGEKSGKTFAYLPAICSLIELENENGDVSINEKGPIAIILMSTRAEAEQLTKICKFFTSSVVFCTDIHNITEALGSIVKAIDILICTPNGLRELEQKNKKYRWFSKNRLKHFVVENINTWNREKLSTLSEVMDNLGIKKLNDIQFIITSRIWTRLLKNFLKLKSFNNPLICVGAHIESAVYSNTQFILKIVKKDIKLNCVLDFLEKNPYEDQKTVILCNADDDVEYLSHEIRSFCFNVLVCTSQSNLDEINIVKANWNNSVTKSILICSDDVLAELNIRDAQNLIHYSLSSSWTKICYRFSMCLQYHENRLIINDKIDVFTEPKKEPAKTLILLDEFNNEQLPKLINFLKRNNIVIDERIWKLAKTIEMEREKSLNMENRSFCSKFIEFGKYHNISQCKGRHIFTSSDTPNGDLPLDGEIKFQLLSIESPTIYHVRILEHKPLNSDLWHFVKQSNAYTSFFMKFDMYFKNSKNHQTYMPIVKNETCVANDKGEYYRCKILEVLKTESRRETDYRVRTKLVDRGSVTIFKSSQLLILPKKFAEFPFQAAELRLLGIVPYDKEETWDTKAISTVYKWFDEYSTKKKMINTAVVQFTLADSIFVKEITMKSELSALKDYIDKINVKKSLLEKKLVSKDVEIENDIKIMAYDIGILKQPFNLLSVKNKNKADRENNSEVPLESFHSLDAPINKTDKNFINESRVTVFKEQWSTLVGSKFSRVTVTSFNSPNSFYVRVKNSQNDSNLKKLYSRIDSFAESEAEPIAQPKIGMNCLAKYDEYYGRCKIIGATSRNFEFIYTLFFVDIGAVKKVEPQFILTTNENILSCMPYQAILCGLAGISSKTLDGLWTGVESNEIYSEFFENREHLYARPMLEELQKSNSILNYSSYKIILLNCVNKKNPMQINSIIYNKGFATKDPDTEHFMDIIEKIEFASDRSDNSESSQSDIEEWESDEDRPIFEYTKLNEDISEREFDVNFDQSDLADMLESLGLPKTMKIVPQSQKELTEKVVQKEEIVSHKTEVEDESKAAKHSDGMLKVDMNHKELEEKKENNNSFLNKLKSTEIFNRRKYNRKPILKKLDAVVLSERMPKLQNRFKTPKVNWQQTETIITLYIWAPNITDYNIEVSNRNLIFSAEIENDLNVLCINLFGCIDAVSHEIRGLNVAVRMIKTIKGKQFYWPRLTEETDKHLWLKYNYESLLNHSDSQENLAIVNSIESYVKSDDEDDSSDLDDDDPLLNADNISDSS